MTESERAMDNRLREVEIQLGRVAQRVEDHEGDIHRFGGLPAELHEIRWAQERMKESIDAAHGAIRELSGRLDREHEERIQGQADRKQELEEAIALRDEDLAKRDAAREQQDKELRNRILVATLAFLGVFITSVVQLLGQLLGGGSGTP